MDTLMALLVVMIAAMPGAQGQHGAERGPKLTLEKMEKPSDEKRLPQANPNECNDASKKFMGACISGKTLTKKTAAQERIRNCNKEASDKKLKGYERLDFVTSCLHV